MLGRESGGKAGLAKNDLGAGGSRKSSHCSKGHNRLRRAAHGFAFPLFFPIGTFSVLLFMQPGATWG